METKPVKLPLRVGEQPLFEGKRDKRMRYDYWKTALCFVRNHRGLLWHRPREVFTIWDAVNLGYRHSVVTYYCGGVSCFDPNRHISFLSDVSPGRVLCERCENEAVRRGLPSAETILGRHVCVGGIKAFNRCGCEIKKG